MESVRKVSYQFELNDLREQYASIMSSEGDQERVEYLDKFVSRIAQSESYKHEFQPTIDLKEEAELSKKRLEEQLEARAAPTESDSAFEGVVIRRVPPDAICFDSFCRDWIVP